MAKTKNQKGWADIVDCSAIIARPCPILADQCQPGFLEYADNKSNNYTYAYHTAYNRADEVEDSGFKKYIMERFNMTDIEYRSLVSSVTGQKSSELTRKEKYEAEINECLEQLQDKDITKKERFDLTRKIANKKRSIERYQTYGTLGLMRGLTKEHNKIHQTEHWLPVFEKQLEALESVDTMCFTETQKKEHMELISEKKKEIEKLLKQKEDASKKSIQKKEELKEKRKLQCFLMGEANQKGNRFVDFVDIVNGKVTLKITKSEHFDITFKVPYNYKKEFEILQKLIDTKEISVSVSFDRNKFTFFFDLAKVQGYAYDEKSYRKDKKEIKQQQLPKEVESEKIKKCAAEYHRLQKEHMLEGKIANRALAFDNDPDTIGWSVVELDEKVECGYRIIAGGELSLEQYMKKTGRASSDKRQKRSVRRKKTALYLALKDLFSIGLHYKCSEIIRENLDGISDKKSEIKEANRKNKNLWCRTIIEKKTTYYCAKYGFSHIKINAAYSTFIGNIQHQEFADPTAASIEIGRRGLMRYIKGSFFPVVTPKDRDTMRRLFTEQTRVAPNKTGTDGLPALNADSSWVDYYKSYKALFPKNKKSDFERRYRTSRDAAS